MRKEVLFVSQVSAWLTVDAGCISQDMREIGWHLVGKIRDSAFGKCKVTVEHEEQVSN